MTDLEAKLTHRFESSQRGERSYSIVWINRHLEFERIEYFRCLLVSRALLASLIACPFTQVL
jgi:hypothetical protein